MASSNQQSPGNVSIFSQVRHESTKPALRPKLVHDVAVRSIAGFVAHEMISPVVKHTPDPGPAVVYGVMYASTSTAQQAGSMNLHVGGDILADTNL